MASFNKLSATLHVHQTSRPLRFFNKMIKIQFVTGYNNFYLFPFFFLFFITLYSSKSAGALFLFTLDLVCDSTWTELAGVGRVMRGLMITCFFFTLLILPQPVNLHTNKDSIGTRHGRREPNLRRTRDRASSYIFPPLDDVAESSS